HGLGVNGYASTPWDTAVGASDFYYGAPPVNPNTVLLYWNTTNGGADGFTSAKQYVPEQPSNSSFQATNVQPVNPSVVVATGGGVSTVGQTAEDGTQSAYPRPSYQMTAASGI